MNPRKKAFKNACICIVGKREQACKQQFFSIFTEYFLPSKDKAFPHGLI